MLVRVSSKSTFTGKESFRRKVEDPGRKSSDKSEEDGARE